MKCRELRWDGIDQLYIILVRCIWILLGFHIHGLAKCSSRYAGLIFRLWKVMAIVIQQHSPSIDLINVYESMARLEWIPGQRLGRIIDRRVVAAGFESDNLADTQALLRWTFGTVQWIFTSPMCLTRYLQRMEKIIAVSRSMKPSTEGRRRGEKRAAGIIERFN